MLEGRPGRGGQGGSQSGPPLHSVFLTQDEVAGLDQDRLLVLKKRVVSAYFCFFFYSRSHFTGLLLEHNCVEKNDKSQKAEISTHYFYF